jgi:hypothetical protein
MAALKAGGAPVIGFVNEGKLVSGGKVDTARVHLLRDWLDAGATWATTRRTTPTCTRSGSDEYESQIMRGETFLRPLLEERRKPRLVPPSLPARRPHARRQGGARRFPARARLPHRAGDRRHSDWAVRRAYRKAIAAKDEAVLAKLRADYVPYMLAKVDYFEQQSSPCSATTCRRSC